jgi:hypothetical protein
MPSVDKTVIFKPRAETVFVLKKVTDDVLEQEFVKAVGYQAKRQFYTNFYINPSFMLKKEDVLDWEMISRTQPLSSTSIKKYADRLSWEDISEFQKLSDDIILKYKKKIHWFEASQYQTLSEEILVQLVDYVDWEFVSGTQKMSIDFMLEHRDKISLDWLDNNPHLTEQEIDTYKILCKMT